MKHRGALFCAIALLALCALVPAQAEIYTAWLDVSGNYLGKTSDQTPDYAQTAAVDFHTNFSKINSVSIQWSGDVTAGLWGYPGFNSTPWPARFYSYMIDENSGAIVASAYTRRLGYNTYPGPEQFDSTTSYTLNVPGGELPGSWDCLLNGRTTFGFSLQMSTLDPMDTPLATGYLGSAMIIVDADPVPEPADALPVLCGLAGISGWLRRRRMA
jgi:hypothetical protein